MLRLFFILTACSTAACAAAGARPQPFPVGRPAPGPVLEGTAIPAAAGRSIASTALALRGTPYRNGGADTNGFDCSGLVKYVFERHGMPMPRSVSEQFRMGVSVAVTAVQPGDLLFFTTTARGVSHVAIALGGDQFIHAPSSNGVVRVERVDGGYWAQRLVGARRVAN